MARDFRTDNRQEENIAKVYLNSKDDFIYIDEKDTSIFDRFAAFLNWLDEKGNEITSKEKELEQLYGKDIITRNDAGEVTDVNVEAFIAFSKFRTETYQEAADQLDKIFGQDTIRKYFRTSYEINPGFTPDDECIYDFLDEITPILNELYSDRAKRISLKYNSNRKGGKRTKFRSKEELIKDHMGK